jgi:class 3 adenylate cyclase
MRCPRCEADNPEGLKCCGECGTPVTAPCPTCGFANPPQFKFCGDCGTRLSGQPRAAQATAADERRDSQETEPPRVTPPATARLRPEAERRQLTVLFCDLVNSTVLAGQLDPEDLRDVIQAFQDTCAAAIHRFDGHIAQYLGDGLLVYFGYPQAHEDDARRAIETGLGMVEAIAALNTHLAQNTGIRLAVRVGIHTGLVVVGEVGGSARQEQLALGETPNVAARILGIAAPDTVVISAATLRLVQGLFSAEELGPSMLKGVATPVQVYRVRGDTGALSRLDVAVTRGLTPLVAGSWR